MRRGLSKANPFSTLLPLSPLPPTKCVDLAGLRIHRHHHTNTMGIFNHSSNEGAATAPEAAVKDHATHTDEDIEVGEVKQENKYAYDDSRKLGITGAVFLILNKMIGTGIFSTPSSIFAATGSVGVCLFLWVIGTLSSLTPYLISRRMSCPY